MRQVLTEINRKDIICEIDHHLNAAHENKERKKASLVKVDPKKEEADRLHENLLNFFHKNNNLNEKKSYRVY